MERTAQGIDMDDYIIAEYYLETPMDLNKAAPALAAEQSTGTWLRVCYESDNLIDRFSARIVEVQELKKEDGLNKGTIKLAFPHINFGPVIPMLLTSVAGNLFEMGEFKNIKLNKLEFPDSWLNEFKGPKFGAEGTMKSLDISGRPMIGTIVKPCVGLSPKEYAEACYQVARGGVDFIKDDELIAAPKYSPIEERTSLTMEAIDKANAEKGEKTMYAVNVTDEVDKIMDNADRALENGANCLMLNFITAGFSALRVLCEDPSVKVPIHCHRDMFAAFTRSPVHGIHTQVVSQLARVCGGDQIHAGAVMGKLYEDLDSVLLNAKALTEPLGHMKPSLTVSSGGQYAGTIPANWHYLKEDALILAGGGIFGHRDGPAAGASSMRQALDASIQGISMEDYAKGHKELAAAIEQFGVAKF